MHRHLELKNLFAERRYLYFPTITKVQWRELFMVVHQEG